MAKLLPIIYILLFTDFSINNKEVSDKLTSLLFCLVFGNYNKSTSDDSNGTPIKRSKLAADT